MKFLFLTDTQIRGNTPINRKGSFLDDLKEKFRETIQIGEDMMVDCYIHGGDMFDSPIVSLSIADWFVDAMERTGKPWYVVRGNHDEIGHNPNQSGESMLDHIFRRSSLVQEMGARSMGGASLFVQGFDYYHGIERDMKENGLISCMPHLTCRKIAIVHAMVTPEPVHPSMQQVLCSEITKTDFSLVLCGHYHKEFGVVRNEKTGTTYVGIGGFARMSRGKWDVERTPNVLFVDSNNGPVMKIIPLESAKSGKELFDMEVIEEQAKMEGRIEDFISSLENTKIQGLNLRNVIEQIAKETKAERAVVEEVIRRIGEFENG